MLITIPNLKPDILCKLLDLFNDNDISYISLKVGIKNLDLNNDITPSISVCAAEADVHGLKSLEEVRQLFLENHYQPLELGLTLKSGAHIDFNILYHKITQRSSLPVAKRPLSTQLLEKNGLIGESRITKFVDEFTSDRYE